MGVLLILLGTSLALQKWSAGAKARACKITLLQTALALPAQQELTSLKEEVGANLARVRAGNGWCFNDEELADLQCQKERFVGLIDYLKPREQAHLILSVEVAYQARIAAGKVDRLRHVLATARVLLSIRSEAEVVEAALLAGVCDDTGVKPEDIESVLGQETMSTSQADSAWQVGEGVSKVWVLSELLERSALLATLEDAANAAADGEDDEAVDVEAAAAAAAEAEAAAEEVAGVGDARAWAGDARAAAFKLPEGMDAESWDKAEQLERQCQMLLAGCDVSRSIIVSLASRLVSMRELQAALAGHPLGDDALSAAPRRADSIGLLDHATPEAALETFVAAGGDRAAWLGLSARKDAFAQQTQEVFVPLAERLGIWYFKTELETLAFAISQPQQFAAISATLAELRAEAEPSVAAAQAALETALAADPVVRQHVRRIKVRSRVKDAYSVWRKMERKGLAEVDELGDVLAFRFILAPVLQSGLSQPQYRAHQAMLCYRALQVIHAVLPMSLRAGVPIRDYVNQPKPNGYRSLHSRAVVNGSFGFDAEVQVRTVEMHNYAEYGRAAHWLYKHSEGRRQVAEGIWQREAAYRAVPGMQYEKARQYRREGRSAEKRRGAERPDIAAAERPRSAAARSDAASGVGAAWGVPAGAAAEVNPNTLTWGGAASAATPVPFSTAGAARAAGAAAEADSNRDSNREREEGVGGDDDEWRDGRGSSTVELPRGARRGGRAPRPPYDGRRPGGVGPGATRPYQAAAPAMERAGSIGDGRRGQAGGAGGGGGAKRHDLQSKPARENLASLGELHSSLRLRRVFVTSDDGVVVSLSAGVSVEEALRTLEATRRRRGQPVARRISDSARLSRAVVNGRTVRDSYIVRNGDVLGDESQSLWLEGVKEEAQESKVEQEADANAGVTPDTRYWVARVPYPWALLQSETREDRMAWEVESERKHGNVALLAGMTWLWLLALGWVGPDTVPMDGLRGLSGYCWAMQGGTFCLFEGRSLLRNVRWAERISSDLVKPSRPNLGRLEPPLWMGRSAMVLVTALALNTDLHTQGGFTHDFLTESPGPMSIERAADFAANNKLEVEAAEADAVVERGAVHVVGLEEEGAAAEADDSVVAPSPVGLRPVASVEPAAG